MIWIHCLKQLQANVVQSLLAKVIPSYENGRAFPHDFLMDSICGDIEYANKMDNACYIIKAVMFTKSYLVHKEFEELMLCKMLNM